MRSSTVADTSQEFPVELLHVGPEVQVAFLARFDEVRQCGAIPAQEDFPLGQDVVSVPGGRFVQENQVDLLGVEGIDK